MVGKIIGAENTGTAMASRVHVFFKGEEVLPTGTKSATEGVFAYASKLLEQVKAGRKINMIFDIDGVLTEISLGTGANPKTLDKWTEESERPIALFKHEIGLLQHSGAFISSIQTGRGFEYAKGVVDLLFPKDGVAYVIAEGGAIIASRPENGGEWKLRTAKSADPETLAVLNRYREPIIKEANRRYGAVLERPAKLIRLTLNPRPGMNGEELKGKVKELLHEWGETIYQQDKDVLEKLVGNITNTPTTAEIMPYGVNKLSALEEMSSGDINIYFGDGDTDMKPMKVSHMGVAPANSEAGIKQFIRSGENSREFIGILASHNDLRGVIDALEVIGPYYRMLRGTTA